MIRNEKIFGVVVVILICVVSLLMYSTVEKPKILKYGIDVLEESNFEVLNKNKNGEFVSKNFAIFTHAGAVNSRGEYSLEVLLKNKKLNCSKIIFPEHGNSFPKDEWPKINPNNVPCFFAHKPVNQKANYNTNDTNSEYATLENIEWIKGLDAVVIDLQDIGIRYYTYTAAILCVMCTCFLNDIEVIILDRPNPLGTYIYGPALNPENKSYLGMIAWQPLFDGMTVAEVAYYVKSRNDDFIVNSMENILSDCVIDLTMPVDILRKGKLTIVKMENYQRDKLLYENTTCGIDYKCNLSPKIQTLTNIFEYAINSLAYIACSEEHTICFKHLINFYVDKTEEDDHVKYNDSCFKYFRFPRKPAKEVIEFLKKFPEAVSGLDLSIVNKNGYEYVALNIIDFRQTNPALFSLALIILAQQLSTAEEWQNLEEKWQPAMLLAHIGDNELYNCLMTGVPIDFYHFKASWEKVAEIFKEETQHYYLY